MSLPMPAPLPAPVPIPAGLRRLLYAACLALLAPAPGLRAQTPMTAAEFDAYVTGKTLSYNTGGIPYGTETYLPGRRVIWAFTEDVCQKGVWYPEGDQICFSYGDGSQPQCWIFSRGETGLEARFMGEGATGVPLVEVSRTDRPLACAAPWLGT